METPSPDPVVSVGDIPGTSKDAALSAVGRTVVNFQMLEHHLKLAARLGPLHGTTQKIQMDVAKRREHADSLTLGQAIQAWLDNCSGTPAHVEGTSDLFDISFQARFSVEFDAESRHRHAKALSDLLEMRNDLIHSRLAKFEWESPQACDHLVVELDSVNAAILEQLQYVNLILTAIVELRKKLGESLVSTLTANGQLDA
jgi:hypothetical protein